MAVRLIEPKNAIQDISEALLKIGTLYQIPNFSEANAMILAEWTADNYKHKTLALILDALKNPAIIYEEGNVTRSWRLTPETVAIWIEKRSSEQETKRQLEETRLAHDKLLIAPNISPKIQETINNYLEKLQSEMFKPSAKREMSPELKRIDLMISLLSQYKKESIDPVTGKPFPDAMDEREWLLSKGLYFENGELKEI